MAGRKGQGLFRRNARSQQYETKRRDEAGDRTEFRSHLKRVRAEVPILLKAVA